MLHSQALISFLCLLGLSGLWPTKAHSHGPGVLDFAKCLDGLAPDLIEKFVTQEQNYKTYKLLTQTLPNRLYVVFDMNGMKPLNDAVFKNRVAVNEYRDLYRSLMIDEVRKDPKLGPFVQSYEFTDPFRDTKQLVWVLNEEEYNLRRLWEPETKSAQQLFGDAYSRASNRFLAAMHDTTIIDSTGQARTVMDALQGTSVEAPAASQLLGFGATYRQANATARIVREEILKDMRQYAQGRSAAFQQRIRSFNLKIDAVIVMRRALQEELPSLFESGTKPPALRSLVFELLRKNLPDHELRTQIQRRLAGLGIDAREISQFQLDRIRSMIEAAEIFSPPLPNPSFSDIRLPEASGDLIIGDVRGVGAMNGDATLGAFDPAILRPGLTPEQRVYAVLDAAQKRTDAITRRLHEIVVEDQKLVEKVLSDRPKSERPDTRAFGDDSLAFMPLSNPNLRGSEKLALVRARAQSANPNAVRKIFVGAFYEMKRTRISEANKIGHARAAESFDKSLSGRLAEEHLPFLNQVALAIDYQVGSPAGGGKITLYVSSKTPLSPENWVKIENAAIKQIERTNAHRPAGANALTWGGMQIAH